MTLSRLARASLTGVADISIFDLRSVRSRGAPQADRGGRIVVRAALGAGSLLYLYTDGLIEATHDMLDGERRLRAAMILAEVVGNRARYAPADVEVILTADGGRSVMHDRDNGPGFEFLPKLPPDTLSESGRGTFSHLGAGGRIQRDAPARTRQPPARRLRDVGMLRLATVTGGRVAKSWRPC